MPSLKTNTIATLIAVFTTVAVSTVAIAETTSEDAAEYREAVMTSLKGHIGAASMHVRGLVEGQEFLVKHAQGLANGAAELKRLFPAGSNVKDSDALPVIWEQPEDFAAAIDKAVAATNKLVDAAAGGDKAAIAAAFKEVGGACRGCHDKFRAEHEHN